MITKLADVKPLLARGRADPTSVFPELKRLAASSQWQTREVAATVLVELGKRHEDIIIRNALAWAGDGDANIRRAASEGLRGIVKTNPAAVRPVLERLRRDADLYVKKSVASVLRNASGKHPGLVLEICERWARERSEDTRSIVRDGLRKLRSTRPRDVEAILASMKRTDQQN